MYSETPTFNCKENTYQIQDSDITRDVLNDLNDIYPFGYATEQFFKHLKTSVHDNIEAWKAENKAKKKGKNDLDFGEFGNEP